MRPSFGRGLIVAAAFISILLFPSDGLAQLRPTLVDSGEVKETRSTPVINRTNIGSTRASRPANSMLVVLTEPKNAEVFINGRPAGRAIEGKFAKELPSRKSYRIKVSAGQDYATFEKTVALRPREPEIVDAPLTSKYGTVKIFPAKEGVAILFDGEPVPKDRLTVDKEDNVIIEKLPAGMHEITYDLPGYVLYKRKFNISPGSLHTWNFIPELAVVEMTVETDPNTSVYVDGEFVGRTTADGKLKASEIKLGEHEIKLVKDFYNEYRESRRFEYQKPVKLIKKLEPLPTAGEFDDNFDTPNQKWTMPRSGATINSGRLNLDNASSLVYPTDINYRDFDMGFHLKLNNAGGAAWVLRAKDPNNYYLFYLSGPDGPFKNTFLTYIVRDNRLDLNSPASSVPVIFDLKAGGQYQVEIRAAGNRVEHTITPAATGRSEKFGFFEDAKNIYQYGGIGFRTVRAEKFSVDELYIRPR